MSLTLTVHRDDDGALTVIGEAPPVIYISDELLTAKDAALDVYGSNVLFHTTPELRYVIVGRSVVYGHTVWIAEKVEEFA